MLPEKFDAKYEEFLPHHNLDMVHTWVVSYMDLISSSQEGLEY